MRAEIQTSMGTTSLGMNEDYVDVDLFKNYGLVLDGASGLTNGNHTGWKSDSAWFAYTVGSNLAHTLAYEGSPLMDALGYAGMKTAQNYRDLIHGCDVARDDEPSAALAAVRWGKEELHNIVEVATLGDCLCVVGFQDGSADVVYDERLDAFDKAITGRMRHFIIEEGRSFAEARDLVNDDLLLNRSLRNQENGYFIADPSCVGYAHALTKQYSDCAIRYIFLCSDGYYSAVKMGICSGFVDLAERVAKGEGKAIMRELREAEYADSEMLCYPRFKICDDATYALLQFE